MTAHRLLKLYPLAWRERYGDEFLDLIGPGDLRASQVVDISMGAIDAWLSPDVHRSATNASITASNGGAMLATFKAAACAGRKHQVSRRDTVIATAVMLGGTFALSAVGVALKQLGYGASGEAIAALAFPLPMTAAMHLMYLKSQPRRVQMAVTGATLVILLGATFLATLI